MLIWSNLLYIKSLGVLFKSLDFYPILDCRAYLLFCVKIEFIQTPISFSVKPPSLLSLSDLIDQRPAWSEIRRVVARAVAMHEGEVDDVVQK